MRQAAHALAFGIARGSRCQWAKTRKIPRATGVRSLTGPQRPFPSSPRFRDGTVIRMTASSNFGNLFSVLVACAFLPSVPMLPLQLLMQQLLYTPTTPIRNC